MLDFGEFFWRRIVAVFIVFALAFEVLAAAAAAVVVISGVSVLVIIAVIIVIIVIVAVIAIGLLSFSGGWVLFNNFTK